MGTSLSGLTPATTFDGLLKTSDNEPLDGTLKAISTGDGTDTILQLSNSALSIGGSVTANEVFTTTAGFSFLRTENNARGVLKTFQADGSASFYNSLNVGSSVAPTSKLQVIGSGATSATTSLLVQNSAGSDLLKVTDDGAIDFGVLGLDFSNDGSGGTMSVASDRYVKLASGLSTYSALGAHLFKTFDGSAYSEAMRITGNTDQFVGIGETTPTARLHVKGSGNDNTTTSLLVQNSDGEDALKVSDDKRIYIGDTVSGAMPSLSLNGFASYAHLNAFNSIDLRINNNSALSINSTKKIGINTTTPTAQLQVKGSGTTSATTALLVQNSDGNTSLEVLDNRDVKFNLGAYQFLGSGFVSFPPINVNNELRVGFGPGTASEARLHVKGSGNDATTTALLVQNSDGNEFLKVRDDGATTIGGGDTTISLNPVNNNNIQKFQNLYYRYKDGTYLGRMDNNGLQIGDDVNTPTARLQVKGSGATSATTALLVENSAGTDLLKVEDGGLTTVDSLSVLDYVLLGQMVLRYDTIYRSNNTSGVLQIQNDSLSFSSTSGVTNDASAMFQLESTTKGFLPPRMTETERDAISTPAAGLMVYNTTTNKAQCYNGTTWNDLF